MEDVTSIGRRGFLKLLGAITASVLVPVPAFVLAEPEILIPEYPVELGTIRAIACYESQWDHFAVRLDAYNGRDQFGIDFHIANLSDIKKIRVEYLKNREIAQSFLREAMDEKGWTASDMITLPIPDDYKEPEWMRG